MHIEEITLEGFKSYATRVTIPNFDPKFNAITGLNGSGKSNILDSICFVLGITNLAQASPGARHGPGLCFQVAPRAANVSAVQPPPSSPGRPSCSLVWLGADRFLPIPTCSATAAGSLLLNACWLRTTGAGRQPAGAGV